MMLFFQTSSTNLSLISLAYLDFIVKYLLWYHLPQRTLYGVQCSLYSVNCTVLIVQCSLYSVHYTVLIVQCSLYSVHCTVFIIQCSLYNVQYTVYIVHYIVCTQCTVYFNRKDIWLVHRLK